ncbi:MAG: hypothetical protein IJS03_07785 [Eubacterium sp.]|nr:hypothetical protein [Eubacterium sp.]
MKNKKLIVLITAAALIILIIGGVILMKFINRPKTYEITSFDTVTLQESGMRVTQVYEITCDGDRAKVSLYTLTYNNGEKGKRLEESADCSAADFIKLLNDCNITAWDGFYGKHPKNVLDGTMFEFEAKLNGDKTVSANGSQNFPKHYHDFTEGLYNILNSDA